ncbi:MAG: hypothetical protein Athens071426_412 [Parcubacteria group bacterium Athens0714_26]|nr:MAG: hypothetical protein Athens071426_412 [Parcubacteria group bacterium Athens0714_26]
MNKITLTTVKKFIKDNDNIYLKVKSSFDGGIDCIAYEQNAEFKKAVLSEEHKKNTLGIQGLWLVLSSRDYFTPYEDETFKGLEISNSCGNSIIAVKKYE